MPAYPACLLCGWERAAHRLSTMDCPNPEYDPFQSVSYDNPRFSHTDTYTPNFTPPIQETTVPSNSRDRAIAEVGSNGFIFNATGGNMCCYQVGTNYDGGATLTQRGGGFENYTHSAGAYIEHGWLVAVDRDTAIRFAGIGGVISRTGRTYVVGRSLRTPYGYTLAPYDRSSHETGRARGANVYASSSWRVVSAMGRIIEPPAPAPVARVVAETMTRTRTYVGCACCGDDIDLDTHDYNWCEECSEYRCEDCGECSDSRSSSRFGVRSWDYKPSPYMPKGNFPAEPLLGVELEIGGTTRDITAAVHDVDDDESHLYMKEDGSISGVEIVTHPMTLAWSRTFPFGTLLEGLRNSGCYVNDGYGLHVHVSRSAFRRAGKRSAPHQMAWLMFMYRNSRKVQQLARRAESRWAAFKAPRQGELAMKATRDDIGDDRYVAVNCNNARTYELRFFASTMDDTEFHAAIEFADASVEYTRTLKTADILRGSALTWSHFHDWAEGRDYPHLLAELEDVAARGESRYNVASRY